MITELVLFIIIGFLAQMVDGTLGMAYGVSSNSALLTLGLTPAIASASIHVAEVFTTLTSGLSHFKVGNVDKKLFKKLTIPGCISASIGAYLLVNAPVQLIKPAVSIYLGIMGGVILLRFLNINLFMYKLDKRILATVGGFVDAIGGGGWGPVVTSTLIAEGENPAKTIGSVNLSEFFVTLCESITFLALLGLQNPLIILGLIIGGVVAAPVGAIVCKKVPKRGLMLLVGILIMWLSIRGLIR